MKLRDLEIFCLVANLGSLSRAASELNMSQPAVSRCLRALETKLDAALFHRTGRGVVLTEAGATFLQSSQNILSEFDSVSSSIRERQGLVTGMVKLAVTPMVGQTITAKLLDRIQREHPNLTVKVFEGNGAAIIEWLASGQIDLAITYIPPAQIGDHELGEVLLEEQLCLIGGQNFEGDSIDFSSIGSFPLAMPSADSGMFRHIKKLADSKKVKIDIVHEIDSFPTILGLVASRSVYAIAPPLAVKLMVDSGSIFTTRLMNPEIGAKLSVHRTPKHPLRRPARALLKILKDEAAKLGKTDLKIG